MKQLIIGKITTTTLTTNTRNLIVHERVKFFMIIMVAMMMSVNDCYAENNMLKFCEKEVNAIRASEEELPVKIQVLESFKSQCAGTGLYEYELSKLYLEARDYKKSLASIDEGLKLATILKKELLLAQGDVYLHQKKYSTSETIYLQVVKSYPDWYAGYQALGFSLLAQGKYEQAIVRLVESSQKLEEAKTFSYLTLAYYSLGQHEHAVNALNKAFQLDQTIVGDRDLMLAGSRSYADLGKFEVAKNLLGMLLKNKPSVREDPEFIKTGLYLRKKMIDAGLILE